MTSLDARARLLISCTERALASKLVMTWRTLAYCSDHAGLGLL